MPLSGVVPTPQQLQSQVVQVTAETDVSKPRARWNSPIEFTITCIGYAVGLGNFWRFPYLCYAHGGGAFLVPYAIVLFTIGIPLFMLELGVGQRAQVGATHAWAAFHPALGGIGKAGVTATFLVALYYNVIVAWAIWFLVHSFSSPLPWASVNTTGANRAALDFFEVTTLHCRGERMSCSWKDIQDWVDVWPALFDTGGLVPPLVLCLAVSWFLIWLCVCKGIESLGKVAWFTAIFPYAVLAILLFRGLTLPGASLGLRFYLQPRFDKLFDLKVWIAAASQIFYSTGVGWGTLVAFASYNEQDHDFVRDAWLVPLINCGTSFLAGLVVFSVLGFMETEVRARAPVRDGHRSTTQSLRGQRAMMHALLVLSARQHSTRPLDDVAGGRSHRRAANGRVRPGLCRLSTSVGTDARCSVLLRPFLCNGHLSWGGLTICDGGDRADSPQ